jgi:hypothetical protein
MRVRILVVAAALAAVAAVYAAAKEEKVTICHRPPGNEKALTLSVGSSAVPAHLAHNDTMGACPVSSSR